MRLAPVIGLETHLQLKTQSKMFCACRANAERLAPNTNICPICLGHPGTLPVVNEQAVRFAILLGLALGGTITEKSKFDRKNYFYPDLPKAYQISQYDLPVMRDGTLTLSVPGEAAPVRIGIERLHLEEDAAKNIHGDGGKTFVDFNRASTPLCEIVTRPDFRSAAAAKAYLQELRIIARMLGVSDADMEKGQLRCDVNVSLREVDEDGKPTGDLHPKTEVKNINSFRAVERAIEFEFARQTKLWEAGNAPTVTTTRGWNDEKQETEEQRTKEDSADYRYFPEPDVPPLDLRGLAAEMRGRLPELPQAKRRRFVQEYGIKVEDAKQIVDEPALADFTEAAMSELGAWLEARPNITQETVPEERQKLVKLFTSWLLNKLGGLLAERGSDIRIAKLTPENFAEFITMLADGQLTPQKGLEVLNRMLDDGSEPDHVMEELGAKRIDDQDALETIVRDILASSPTEVIRYKNGEEKLFAFFLGQVMKATKGNADPARTAEVIKDALSPQP